MILTRRNGSPGIGFLRPVSALRFRLTATTIRLRLPVRAFALRVRKNRIMLGQLLRNYSKILFQLNIKPMTTKSKKTATVIEGFDYTSIKTFEDACKSIGVDPESVAVVYTTSEEFRKPIVAYNKLLIIYKAINSGWKPDWNNLRQYKYYPYFEVLSSGLGFSSSDYYCVRATTAVGSRLCTDTSEKALYIAKQFEALCQDYFLFSE